MLLGHRLVMMYHHFFRFPELAFRADRTAFPLALLVCAAAATAGVFSAVRRAARLPPAEAMRPEPPANYRPAFVERTGIAHLLSHTFRIAVRNLERKTDAGALHRRRPGAGHGHSDRAQRLPG